jgi:hypothetical protein
MTVFHDAEPSSVVDVDSRVRVAYCLASQFAFLINWFFLLIGLYIQH